MNWKTDEALHVFVFVLVAALALHMALNIPGFMEMRREIEVARLAMVKP